MGGDATFAGTSYQARVIACVYAHILAESPLGWLAPLSDVPLTVSAETGGPGDDARVELVNRYHFEVQAKHGLTAGQKLDEVIAKIRDAGDEFSTTKVVLVVDRTSSKTILRDVRADLERFRSGREDSLKAEFVRIKTGLASQASLLRNLHIAIADVDLPQDPEIKFAIALLELCLADKGKAAIAFSALTTDAADLCAKRERRTRRDLVERLHALGIDLRPPDKDATWHRQLDSTKKLLRAGYVTTVLVMLRHAEKDLGKAVVDPTIRYRLYCQYAAALSQTSDLDAAYDATLRALEYDPVGIEALTSSVHIALKLGRIEAAYEYLQKAQVAHPNDPQTWGATAALAAARGAPLPAPPSGVADSEHYLLVLAEIAFYNSDWNGVLAVTRTLLGRFERRPQLLLMHANALLSSRPGGASVTEAEDAQRAISEAIDGLDDDAHPLTATALVLRSQARRVIGNTTAADDDLRLACDLEADNPDALKHLAQTKIEAGELAAAANLLEHPIVSRYVTLLALRAQARANIGAIDGARADLASALAALSRDSGPHQRIACAEAAIELREYDTADRLLTPPPETNQIAVAHLGLRARLAGLRGNLDLAERLYREAAEKYPSSRSDFLSELALQHAHANQHAKAVNVFEEVGIAHIPAVALKRYATSILAAEQYLSGKRLLETISKHGTLPDWALSLAANIALRQEDWTAALKHLQELVSTGRALPRAHIILCRILLENERRTEAEKQAATLLATPVLSPVDRVDAAHVALLLGRKNEALRMAVRAYREAPDDPLVNRAFVTLNLLANVDEPPPTEVAAECHVRLEGPDGRHLNRTIFHDPPFDLRHGELSVKQAKDFGLLGKRVGDTITIGTGWVAKEYKVTELIPARVQLARDALHHYEERFNQSDGFFVSGFSVGDLNSVRDLAPFIASTHERETRAKMAFEAYGAHVFPLGFVGTLLGKSLSDVIDALNTEAASDQVVFVEWADATGQDDSLRAAVDAEEIILARSALHTTFKLGIEDNLLKFRILVPTSLVRELRIESEEARKNEEEGLSLIAAGAVGLQMQDLPPQHPVLTNRRTLLERQLRWVTEHASVVPRPLETIEPLESQREHLREIIGASSADSVALARHAGLGIYADDLGLRRILDTAPKARSFSTPALLAALAERGHIAPDYRDRALLKLLKSGYAIIAPTPSLLHLALRESSDHGYATTRRAFALLAAARLTPRDAANIAAILFRMIATSVVRTADIEFAAQLVLDAMVLKFPFGVCAQAVHDASRVTLRLLPNDLQDVQKVIARFVNAHKNGAPYILRH